MNNVFCIFIESRQAVQLFEIYLALFKCTLVSSEVNMLLFPSKAIIQ